MNFQTFIYIYIQGFFLFFFRITILYMNCVHEYSQSQTKPDLASFNQLSHVYTRYKNITFLELLSCCHIIYLNLYQAFSITKIVPVAVIELQIFFFTFNICRPTTACVNCFYMHQSTHLIFIVYTCQRYKYFLFSLCYKTEGFALVVASRYT